MEVLGYIGAMIMGLSLGLIGGGGSILSVPIFVYLFGIAPVQATAYSLFVVGLASLIGGLRYAKSGQVDFKTGLLFGAPAFLGVFVARRFVVPAIPEEIVRLGSFVLTKDVLIMLVFALLMVVASLSMIRQKKPKEKKADLSPAMRVGIILAEGLIVGGITGFVGAGGGFLIIPALVLLTGLPMKLAIGTSLMIIAAKSLLGFLGDLSADRQMDWLLLILFSAISIVGIWLGSHWNAKVPEAKLKKGFGYFVLVMGSVILIQQIVA